MLIRHSTQFILLTLRQFKTISVKRIFTFLVLIAPLFSAAQSTSHGQHRITLDPTLKPFYHGVASGDPLPDGVMIWTRVTPDSGNVNAIPVFWQIAKDLAFTQVVNYGKRKLLVLPISL